MAGHSWNSRSGGHWWNSRSGGNWWDEDRSGGDWDSSGGHWDSSAGGSDRPRGSWQSSTWHDHDNQGWWGYPDKSGTSAVADHPQPSSAVADQPQLVQVQNNVFTLDYFKNYAPFTNVYRQHNAAPNTSEMSMLFKHPL